MKARKKAAPAKGRLASLTIRASAEQRAAWEAAAAKAGAKAGSPKTLGEWVREACDREAAKRAEAARPREGE